MRILLILLSILFVNSVVAEPKRLVCDSSAAAEAARWTKDAEDPWYQKNMSQYISGYRDNARRCEEFGKYGFRNVYTFDTKGLSNSQFSKAEASRVSCMGYNSGVVESKLSATPSIISFQTGDGETFNIDRKTLKAGYEATREYKCKLEDIDTSENLI
jgi:hypothetical protein